MSVGLAVQCKVLKSSYRQHIKVGKQNIRYSYGTDGRLLFLFSVSEVS